MTVNPVKHHKRYGGDWDPEEKFWDSEKQDYSLFPTRMTTGKYGVQVLIRILKARGGAYTSSDKKDRLANLLHDYLDEWIPASKMLATTKT